MWFTRWFVVISGLLLCLALCLRMELLEIGNPQPPILKLDLEDGSRQSQNLEIVVEPIEVPGRDSSEASIAQAITLAALKAREPNWQVQDVTTSWVEDHYNIQVDYLDETGAKQSIDLQLVPPTSKRNNTDSLYKA